MKKSMYLLLALILVLSLMPFSALAAEQATVASGTCGEKLTWALTEDGILTISGTGKMEDYSEDVPPWYSHRSKIMSVFAEDGVTYIGDYAFNGCYKMTDITIPNSVTSIGNGAFDSCGNLKNITVSDGNLNYRSVDGVLFDKECATLICYPGGKTGDYTIPMGVTSIANCAFYRCSSLTSVTIPNSVASIGNEAFFGSNLTGITIPNSVTSIGDGAFADCGSIKEITVSDGNLNYRSVDGVLFDKECATLICYPGGKTGDYTIPMGVTRIGNYAFCKCARLTSVTISASVTSIGDSAFGGCSSLTSITIPDGVTSIGDSTFAFCYSLADITIPKSVTSIGDSAFAYSDSLTGVTIPDGVTSIGEYAFSGCSSLTSIMIPNSVTSIGDSVFSYCNSLTSITIPNSVTSIGQSAFYNCSSLTSITIPNSVTSIGNYAFQECHSLTSVTLPNSMTSIGNDAFSATDLTSITIPNGVTGISGGMFYNCWSLTSITIPNSVTSIGVAAFEACPRLTSITIPDSVTIIDEGAFWGCESLTDIYVLNRETQLDTSNIPAETTIHGYSGSTAETYASSNGNKFVPLDSENLFQISGVAMNLGNSLSMIFYVPVENVSDGDYALITKSYAEGRGDATVKVSLTGAQTELYAGKNCYMVGFDSIAAKEMNDNVSCVVCHADGTPASKPYNATVKAYAEVLLTIDDANLKTLMVDLLNYGAAAQKAFDYDEEHYANKDLTDEQKKCATQDKDINLNALAKYKHYEGATPTEITLLLKNNIRLMIYYPAGSLDSVKSAKISYTDHRTGAEETISINASDFITEKDGKKCLIIDSLRPADYKTVLTVKLCDETNNVVSRTDINLVLYCALNSSNDTSIPLVKYCQAAYNYFEK